MLNGLTATYVLYELAGGSTLQERNVAYLRHAIASGEHPRLAGLLAQPPDAGAGADVADLADRYRHIMTRILAGLLGDS